MRVINLTPHQVKLVTPSGVTSFEPSDVVARCATTSEAVFVNGIDFPLTKTTFGEVEGLPEEKPDTMYIVSGLVLAQSGRKDLLAPGNLVRNDQGQVIGCGSFNVA